MNFRIQPDLLSAFKTINIFLFMLFHIQIYSQPLNNSDVEIITNKMIFSEGTFKACHASTIAELNQGIFMAAWFAGTQEGAKDVCIWASTSENNKWSVPEKIAEGYDSLGNQLPCWNPVLFKSKGGKLFLFYKVGINPREWWGMVIQSSDNGKNWSVPQTLPQSFLGPIKNKPRQLDDGSILLPSSVESHDARKWTVHLEITDEKLSSWKRIDIEADDSVGVIQPALLKHSDGKLQMLCRSRQNLIYETWSTDNGLRWSKLEPTSVPNPNSGIDAVSLDNGMFLLVYNPLLHGEDWVIGRNMLNAAISGNGIDWKDIYQLEKEADGEFSYPAVIQASDKSIHITYTYNRKNIKHVMLKHVE